MAQGTVKVWSKSGGYGWIKPDGVGDEVYVHKSNVTRTAVDKAASLEPGQRVEYQIGTRPKGSAAVNVKVVTGAAAAPAAPADESDEATS